MVRLDWTAKGAEEFRVPKTSGARCYVRMRVHVTVQLSGGSESVAPLLTKHVTVTQ